MEQLLERAARNCYQSEPRGNTKGFLQRIIKLGHLSVIEHCVATVCITCSRSCSHQLVRHRLGSYSQESQRYVNYGKKPMRFIAPARIEPGRYTENDTDITFIKAFFQAQENYEELLAEGEKPEDAREVLPNATATKIVTTFNMRTWRHIFEHRALNPRAQKQIREIMLSVLKQFKQRTYIFDDLGE